jgi:quinol monooxygenase YgiN
MLLIIGSVRVPPANLDAARPAMAAMVAASRTEQGCIEYSYAEDLFDAGLIRVTERWTTRAALEAHFGSPHIREWRAVWPRLGIGERDLTLYEAGIGTAI